MRLPIPFFVQLSVSERFCQGNFRAPLLTLLYVRYCVIACSDNLISYYFDLNNTEVDKVGEEVFKKQLYQCMISQALELKGDIETRRAGNTYGIIVWQCALHFPPLAYFLIYKTDKSSWHRQRDLANRRCATSTATTVTALQRVSTPLALTPTPPVACDRRLGHDRVRYTGCRTGHRRTLETDAVLVQEIHL